MLTVKEAAAFAHVHPETIRRWIRSGVLKASRPGGRVLLIARAELDRVLAGGAA